MTLIENLTGATLFYVAVVGAFLFGLLLGLFLATAGRGADAAIDPTEQDLVDLLRAKREQGCGQ